MINGVHSIFPPPEVTSHPGGDPISEKKLNNGDGTWSTKKEILGWIFDGENSTITLPPEKCNAIIKQIHHLLKLTRPSLNKFQHIAGKLQHASMGIPSGWALFSPIQIAMRNDPPFINLTTTLKKIFKDWQYFIKYMKNNLTSVLQLVINYPDYLGHSDSCKLGTGGVWNSGLKPVNPFMWQLRWSQDIQDDLISESNPKGRLTINDLELTGLVLS